MSASLIAIEGVQESIPGSALGFFFKTELSHDIYVLGIRPICNLELSCNLSCV